jgi:hypothetical protein
VTSKVGGDATEGHSAADSAGNVGYEGNAWALLVRLDAVQPHRRLVLDVGRGRRRHQQRSCRDPAKLSEKVELVYDSACGWGVKGSGGVSAGAAGAGVEGAIFFTKAL